MKKFRIGIIVCLGIIILVQLTMTDYSNLSWSNNSGSYWGVISMTLLIMSMVLSNRYDKRKSSSI